jgi:co-chaperonin GroES (HSP10)
MGVEFFPASDRYLVAVIDQEHMLEGVLLPDSAKKDMLAGKILAAGPQTVEYTKADFVLFGPWAGKEIQLEGVPFRLLREEEIDGKVVYDAGTKSKGA